MLVVPAFDVDDDVVVVFFVVVVVVVVVVALAVLAFLVVAFGWLVFGLGSAAVDFGLGFFSAAF